MARGRELSPQLRSQICELHNLGYGYKRIFKIHPEVPLSTIKYTCQQEAKRKENQSRPRSGAPRKLPSRERRPRRKDDAPTQVDDVVTHTFTDLDATYQTVTYHDLLAMVDWSIFPIEQLHPTDDTNLTDDAVAQIEGAVAHMDDTVAQIGDTVPQMDDVVAQMDGTIPHIDNILSHMDNVVPQMDDTIPQMDDIAPHIDDIVLHIDDLLPQMDDTITRIENIHIDDTTTHIDDIVAQTDLDLTYQDLTYQDVTYHELLALVDWSIVW
jgi:hypothetical protein